MTHKIKEQQKGSVNNKQTMLFLWCCLEPALKQQCSFCHADLHSLIQVASFFFFWPLHFSLPAIVRSHSSSHTPRKDTHVLFLPSGYVWLRHEINFIACTLPPLLWRPFSLTVKRDCFCASSTTTFSLPPSQIPHLSSYKCYSFLWITQIDLLGILLWFLYKQLPLLDFVSKCIHSIPLEKTLWSQKFAFYFPLESRKGDFKNLSPNSKAKKKIFGNVTRAWKRLKSQNDFKVTNGGKVERRED